MNLGKETTFPSNEVVLPPQIKPCAFTNYLAVELYCLIKICFIKETLHFLFSFSVSLCSLIVSSNSVPLSEDGTCVCVYVCMQLPLSARVIYWDWESLVLIDCFLTLLINQILRQAKADTWGQGDWLGCNLMHSRWASKCLCLNSIWLKVCVDRWKRIPRISCIQH